MAADIAAFDIVEPPDAHIPFWGDDAIRGGADGDFMQGGLGDDTVEGLEGDDVIHGNSGIDVIRGGAGADTVFGGRENDSVYGDGGGDRLSGDRGADNLFGGAGADRFVFGAAYGQDWVCDFDFAQGDRILLAAGTRYTVTSHQGQILIDLGGGDVIGLAGVGVFDDAYVVYG